MQILIQRENGTRSSAVVLTASTNRMRVVVRGCSETEEWQNLDGVWRDESGAQIEIEALIAITARDWSRVGEEPLAWAMALGTSKN